MQTSHFLRKTVHILVGTPRIKNFSRFTNIEITRGIFHKWEKMVPSRVKIVTVVSLSLSILFCTATFKSGTGNQDVFGSIVSPSQYIEIKSNTDWAGSIYESSSDYTVTGSHGNARFDIDCKSGSGPFSVVFDKKSVFGNLTVSLLKNGTVLDTQTTTDSFGGVQISGRCEISSLA